MAVRALHVWPGSIWKQGQSRHGANVSQRRLGNSRDFRASGVGGEARGRWGRRAGGSCWEAAGAEQGGSSAGAAARAFRGWHCLTASPARRWGSRSADLPILSPRLLSASDRESRLEEVRSAFVASYSRTIGLKAVPPSPSGAIGGLLEQFVRGVGLRGSSTL